MNNIKIEYQKVHPAKASSLGVMVEINAPAALDNALVTRQPRGIVFVIDRSGSMGGGRIEVVKSTILDILGQLDKNDYLSVVSFDNRAEIVQPMAEIGTLNLAELRKTIGEIEPRGGTNLEGGYRAGLAEAASAPNFVETTVILLSDGHANQGSQDPVELGRLAAAATEHLIATSTLGIGEQYDERILVEMSNTGRGNHFAAVNFAEAALGLNEEISGLLTRTISNLKVTVRTEGAIRQEVRISTPHYVHGSRSIESGSRQFELGAMGSLEERNFVVELHLPVLGTIAGGLAGEVFVEAEFLNEVTGQMQKFGNNFTIEVGDAENWVEPAHDEDIVMELATVRAQVTKEQAMQLAREGHIDEARQMLEALGIDIDAMTASMQDLSPRNRARAERHRRELAELANMNGEMFIKRSAESIKRGYSSKPDPRDLNNEEEA
jgi:Ca-activated chloride channel homolog